MSDVILRVEQGGRLLGEWSLGPEPLSLSLRDPATGRVLARMELVGSLPAGQPAAEPVRVDTHLSGRPHPAVPGAPPAVEEADDGPTVVGAQPLVDEPTSPLPEGGGYDELPVPGVDMKGPLVRSPGDDFTMPLPESTATGDGLTADLVEVQGRAEVWTRRNGQWVLKGMLGPGQRARMRDGSVRCMDGGSLAVSPGPWLHGSADLPSGKQIDLSAGQRPIVLPPGASVTLWDGERGMYVRSDVPVDDLPPVEHHRRGARPARRRGGRSRSDVER